MYSTDIHDPTLSNAAYNARLNIFTQHTEEDDGEMKIKMTSKIDEKYIEEVTILNINTENTANSENSESAQGMDIEIDKLNISNTVFNSPKDLSTTSSSILRVAKVSWSDANTFPPQADVLIGSDLVYDSKILSLLTKAVDGMLISGK